MPKPVGRDDEPIILYVDPHHATGVLGNVIISYSIAEPNMAYLENWIAGAQKLAVANELIACMTVIDSDAKPPSDAIRLEIKKTFASFGEKITGVAQVVEGKGFVAAAKRAAVSMIMLLARVPFPISCFGEVTEAAIWLCGQMQGANPQRLDARTITSAAEVVRRAQIAGRATSTQSQ
ncbi:MAG TPA: hypothetical protein VGP93_01370 [Polyangiaceae bacterium]|nr:hypothetical protein [Polyangiaceae bacterium]